MAREEHQRMSAHRLVVILCLLAVRGSTSLNCPEDITPVSGTRASLHVQWNEPTNSTCTPEPGSSFEAGKETVVVCDNGTLTCSFTVFVQDTGDPTFQSCDDLDVNTDMGMSFGTAVWNLVAMDNAGEPSITCNPLSGSPFDIGSHTVRCTATDAADNTAQCTFQVVVNDREAPEFSNCQQTPVVRFIRLTNSPHSQTYSSSVTWEQPTATDNSGDSVTYQSSHQPGDLFPLGPTTVIYNASDFSGNYQLCEFEVLVLVRPPSEHIYIFTPPNVGDSESCLHVRWPISEQDRERSEKSIFYWQEEKGKMTTPRQEVIHTYGDLENAIIPTYGGPHEICKLAPGELYTVEVDGARSQHWTRPTQPSAVSIVAGTLSSSSVELTWTPVSQRNVQQYKVRVSSEDRVIRYVTRMTNRLRVDGLRPSQSHTVSVQTVVGSGAMRMESTEIINHFQTAPLAGSDLMAYFVTESTISIAWLGGSAVSSPTEPYMLFIEPQDAEKSFLTVHQSGNPATASFQGLQPNSEYYIRLIHNSGLSLNTTQRTRPAPVENLRPTEVLEESFTLEWDPPTDGYIDSYEVYISPGSSIDPIRDVTGTSYTFQSLEPMTEYYVSVESVYKGMKSVPRSLMVTTGVTTPADRAPLNILLLALGVGLGLTAIVLFTCIVVMCRRVRRQKAEMQKGGGRPTGGGSGEHSYENEIFGLKNLTLRFRHRAKEREPARGPKVYDPPEYDVPDING